MVAHYYCGAGAGDGGDGGCGFDYCGGGADHLLISKFHVRCDIYRVNRNWNAIRWQMVEESL